MQRIIRILVLLAIAGAMPAAVSPAHAQDPIDQALEYAPPGVCGVVHLNFKPVHKEMARVCEANKNQLGSLAVANFALAGKADSADIMFIDREDTLMYFFVVRGAMTPADVGKMFSEIFGEAIEPVPAEDGRYMIGPITTVWGKEASDVSEGVLLIGYGKFMAPNRLKNMPKPDLADLKTLLKETDTSMPLWGAMITPDFMADPDDPVKRYGAVDPTGKGKGKIVLVMSNEEEAAKGVEKINQEDPHSIKHMFVAKQAGNKIIGSIPESDKTFMQRFADAIISERRRANREESEGYLHHIGRRVQRYQQEYDRLPSSFTVLLEEGRMSMWVLDSPLDGRELTRNPETDEWTGQPDDYVYIDLNSVQEEKRTGLIMVHETPDNDPTGQVNVLLYDKHDGRHYTENMSKAELEKKLAETQKAIKKTEKTDG